MNEIWNSITMWFKERTTSPLYGAYIFSTIVWNWKFFFTLFLQDQASLPMPKIEYIEKIFLSDSPVWHFIAFFVPPILITYAIIWWLPIISGLAHECHLRFYFYRKSIYDKERLSYEESRKHDLKRLAGIKEEQVASEKRIQKNLSNEERWEEEYREFSKSSTFERFDQIINVIYERNGYIHEQNGKRPVDSDVIAAADTRGLIKFSGASRYQIDFTEKGKFFAKKYLDNPPIPF